ncbi:MAG: tRNA (adenosine(37)-N6)-threonylcarbamoyltransferase complex dimerization subunit type 1 TsaB [Betaproteobacteria bacterium]
MKDDSAAYSGSLLAISSSATPAAMGRFDAHGQSLWIYAEVGLKTGEGLLAALGQHFKGRPEALELIVLDRGPGQFTGLRAGIGLAQGLSMGWGIPILAIDSASVMAWSAWERLTASTSSEGSQMLSPALPRDRTQTRFVSIRDARLGAYYVAVFESLESLASSDCDSVRALSLAQVLALLRQLSAGEQGDALVLLQATPRPMSGLPCARLKLMGNKHHASKGETFTGSFLSPQICLEHWPVWGLKESKTAWRP